MAVTVKQEARLPSPRRVRRGTVAVLALALLVAVVAWRLVTESTPSFALRRTLPTSVRLAGKGPVLAWPHEGQAAVEVEGVGDLGTVGGSTPVPIASVAKIMTAYLTLLAYPLGAGGQGFTLTITPDDVEDQRERVAQGQSTLPVKSGERLSERQALEALLLPSANNIAELLAIHDAGAVQAFVGQMNSAARNIGMYSTTYTDPSGFQDETVSTAADQLKLARVAMEEPVFARIVAESSAELPVAGRVGNYDGLVGSDGYVGVKTGSDRAAGGCLVFAKHATVAGRRLTVLGVVLGQRDDSLIDAALESARRLGDSAADAVRLKTVLPAGSAVLEARSADGRRATGATAASLRELGWGGLSLPVRLTRDSTLAAIRAGQRLATVSVGVPHGTRAAALAVRSPGGPSLGWRLRHLL